MPTALPALNLVAAPGQRRATLDMAREIEQRGFAGISASSQYSNMSQCLGLAFATERIAFATAIAPIYAATAEEFANSAAYLHEVSGGRFQFGIGVAHAPPHQRIGVTPGRPLADIRDFVAKLRSVDGIGAVAADHPRRPAPADGGARGRDRRRRRLCQCGPLAHGGFARRAFGGEAQRPRFLCRQPHPHLCRRRSARQRRCCGARSRITR